MELQMTDHMKQMILSAPQDEGEFNCRIEVVFKGRTGDRIDFEINLIDPTTGKVMQTGHEYIVKEGSTLTIHGPYMKLPYRRTFGTF